MIDRIFMIACSIACLLAMFMFVQQDGLRPFGQVRHFKPVHYASPTVPGDAIRNLPASDIRQKTIVTTVESFSLQRYSTV